MRRFCMAFAFAVALAVPAAGLAQSSATGPFKVIKTAKVAGVGGWDYIYADSNARRLYIARNGPARINVYDLDTLAPVGEIMGVGAHGAVVDPKSGNGFASSKPVTMFDAKTLMVTKMIDVDGNPDGMLFDPFDERVWVFSHVAPNATVIDAKDGSVVGTVDLGGEPEQAVTDGKGHLYVDIEDKDSVAVVDAKTLMTTGHYMLNGKGGGPGALAFDAKNHVLFIACHDPATMVIMNADNGNIITTLPIGMGVDSAEFNPATMEAFSSQGDGTLTVIKENSPSSFAVEQTVQTEMGARTSSLDFKTGHVLLDTAQFGPPPAPGAEGEQRGPGAGAERGPGGGGPGGGPGARGGPGGRRGFARGPMIEGSFTIIEVGK